MQQPSWVFMSIALLMIADGLIVNGPSGPLVAHLGSSVVLPCYVEQLLSVEDLEVEWRRTDSETLVHLYQDGESQTKAHHQDYQGRAHLFTDQIQHGNFSLRLDNLRAEDEGRYTCTVYSQRDSGETVVQIKDVERLLVTGSDESISASVGENIILNCSVVSHIPPEHINEVSWKKTDEDENILVLLYQNNESLLDSSDKRYRDRVEFFTDEIHKGNFSLRLNNIITEDRGVYMCQVFAGELSANATVVLEQLGFSTLHIIMMIICISASGSALLLFYLIYCTSHMNVTNKAGWFLQHSYVICPNICMLFAFIFWGLTEGFLNETVTCCALFILRPFMLIKHTQDIHNSCIRFSSLKRELAASTVIVYSLFYTYSWKICANDRDHKRHICFGVLIGFLVIQCIILIRGFTRMHIKWIGLYFLSLAQFVLLISLFGLPSLAFLAMPLVHGILLMCMPYKFLNKRWIQMLWITTILLLDFILVIYVHVCTLQSLKDYMEWICIIAFLEVIRIKVAFESIYFDTERAGVQRQQQQISHQRLNSMPPFHKIMHIFGAIGIVLLNSFALMAELILKARNSERVVKDLRVIVFPSECVFTLYWLAIQIHAFLMNKSESIHNQRNLNQRHRRNCKNTPDTSTEENLSAADSADAQKQK